MQRDDIRKIVADQFYDSLTASGVQITAVPSGQLRAMVEAMADGVFAAIAAVELEGDQPISPPGAPESSSAVPPNSDATGAPTPENGPAVEHRIWQGRPYLTIGTRYELTTQRLRVYRGVLGNRIEEVELIRVKDTRVKQHMGERMLNIGDVSVISADPTTPEIVLQNVHDPIQVREALRKAVMDEKTRRGLRYREDIAEENR